MLPMGCLAIKTSSQMLRIPRNILMPIILMFCIVGAFAINNSIFDVGIVLVTGILAYAMESHEFPIAPVILGMIIGPILEENFMVSMIKSQWDFTIFFTRPISATLGVVTLMLWIAPLFLVLKGREGNKKT